MKIQLHNRLWQRILCIFVLLCGLCACGGGTRGTGGKEFESRVVDSRGTGVPGVTVTIAETGDSAVTDSSGNCSITTEVEGTVNIFFEGNAVSASSALADIPSEAATVSAVFVVSDDRRSVEPTDISVEKHRGKGGSDDSKDEDDQDKGSGGNGSNSGGNPGTGKPDDKGNDKDPHSGNGKDDDGSPGNSDKDEDNGGGNGNGNGDENGSGNGNGKGGDGSPNGDQGNGGSGNGNNSGHGND